jgi:hypothetical protein
MPRPLIPLTPGELNTLWGAWRKGITSPPKLGKVIGRSNRYIIERFAQIKRYISKQERQLVKRQPLKAGQRGSSRRSNGRPAGDRKFKDNPYLTPEILRMAGVAGYNGDQVAKLVGCSRHTLHNYLKENPKLRAALEQGRENADLHVVNAFYKRAVGMKIKTTKFATYQGRILDEKEYNEEFPPDVEAGKFWLVNRKPEEWSRAPTPLPPDGEKTEYDIRERLYDETANNGTEET